MVEAKGLTESQKVFCREYVLDWNGSRAYKVAYPDVTDATARANSSRLLTNANIKAFQKELCDDDEKYAGLSRRLVLQEHKKIATSSIADLHETWITRKEFSTLTNDQKSTISEISTQIRRIVEMRGDVPIPIEVEFVKIKLYDKQKSLDSICRMLGYDAAEKIDLGLPTIKSYRLVAARERKRD